MHTTAHALLVDDRQRVDRARLEKLIVHRALELARQVAAADTASAQGLDTLLTGLTRHNPEALTHARRVAGIATAIGIALGLPDTELVVVARGALLHDIGKLAMPAALMCKPAALTGDEIHLLRSHPEIGAAIVADAPALRLPADIVRSSHEAWDGSGYPGQLEGAMIPLGGRITAVADTYDALTWSRAAAGPVAQVSAIAELVRCAGTLFDPEVVRSWLRVLDDGRSRADAGKGRTPGPADFARFVEP